MKFKRVLIWLVLGTLALVLGVGLIGNAKLNGSLPLLDGEVSLAGLQAPVTVTRDLQGIPTIHAQTRGDAARALGFVHAQDRFFQMDLLRRQPAGRLSELFGRLAVNTDLAFKLHRFEDLANRLVASLSPAEQAIVEAYTEGVNAGLNALGTAPFEYLLLRVQPEPWQPRDCFLTTLAMYCDLQDQDGRNEYSLGVLKENLSPAAFAFLMRAGTPWDAPILGDSIPQPPVPDAESWSQTGKRSNSTTTPDESEYPGSNNWAVGGRLTADGRAILASDMHLGHSVPTIWYRAVMDMPSFTDPEKRVRMVGVTLPGTFATIVGSNGSVAWAYTNSYGDYGDVIELKMVDDDHYQTASGPRPIERKSDRIMVKGEPAQNIESEWTEWGPVIRRSNDGRLFVHRWVGHDLEGSNLNLLKLESVGDLGAAMAVANSCGIPAQNFVCVDASGQIGWTIAGRLPRRPGLAPRTPVDWSDGSHAWQGYLEPDEYPRIINPPSDRVWSANARVASGSQLALIGDGGYDLGARAGQIRDRLLESDRFSESDFLAIQLDDEARFLTPWRDLLLQVIEADPDCVSPDYRQFVIDWGGHASVDSVGYRLVRAFRLYVHKPFRLGLTQPAQDADDWFSVSSLSQFEGVVWQILQERPSHLLPDGYQDWAQFLASQARAVEAELGPDLTTKTWGARNTVTIEHPLSGAVPIFGKYLNMTTTALPGGSFMPRVQSPRFGASERMIVSPGHEEDGIFHMPGGQSAHPKSPFYRSSFNDWAEGNPSPLLPGPTIHTLSLIPKP